MIYTHVSNQTQTLSCRERVVKTQIVDLYFLASMQDQLPFQHLIEDKNGNGEHHDDVKDLPLGYYVLLAALTDRTHITSKARPNSTCRKSWT